MSLLEPEEPAPPPPQPFSTVLGAALNPGDQSAQHPTHLRRVGLVGLVIGVPLAVVGVMISMALIRYFGSVNKLTILPGGYGALMVVTGLYRVVVAQFPVIGRVSALRMLLLLVLFIAFSVFVAAVYLS